MPEEYEDKANEEAISVSSGRKRHVEEAGANLEGMGLSSIQSMQRQLEQLQEALKKAQRFVVSESVQEIGPSSSVPPVVEGSNATEGPRGKVLVSDFELSDMYDQGGTAVDRNGIW